MPQVKGFSTGTMRSFRAAAKNINTAARQLGDQLGPGLRMIAEEILTDVKDARQGKGVPVKDGHLRGSGRADGPGANLKKPVVSISFGGSAAPYALIQHEVLTFRHTVGEARYLVRGLERWRKGASAAWSSLQRKAKDSTSKDR